METRAHHVLIGLFAVLVIAGMLLFGLWLAEGGLERHRAEYRIVFSEAVSGLSVGSNVKYNGIKVGEVTELKLDPRDPRRVQARIKVKPNTPIRQNTHAQIRPTGLLSGRAHIRLSGGSPESLPLLSESPGVAEIPARPSPFTQLQDQSGDILTSINKLMTRMESLLSERNLNNLDRTLANTAELTNTLAQQQDGITTAVDEWNRTGRDVRTTLKETRALLTETRSMLDEDASGALRDGAEAARSTRRTMAKVEALVSRHEDSLASAMEGSSDLGPTLEEMRRTLGALRKLARRLESDGAGTLLNRDKLEEYQP